MIKKNHRLVGVHEASSPEFWDKLWGKAELKKKILDGSKNPLVISTTQKYLPKGSRILEGGAGMGKNVYDLKQAGYDAVGIDYAPETVGRVKEAMADLDMRLGDVRRLPFEDESFDGYWSLGVIEHFYEGYEQVANEMNRVLRPGGILFLTFPYLSFLRNWKIKNQSYPGWDENQNKENFYQFILDWKRVFSTFEKLDFKLIERRSVDGVKGLKDDWAGLRPYLQKIYDSPSLLFKVVRRFINVVSSPVAGHIVLLVLKKKTSGCQ